MVRSLQFLSCFNGCSNNTRSLLFPMEKMMENKIIFMNQEFSNHMLVALLLGKKVSKNRIKKVKKVYL